ncbi:hypothetical protein IRZ71_18875 [Flavobacterium sp. ANB]|uniref:hypothetical protein n=1 Tax=unclassified Flavobacterium TaxID=196869 RepID=UPI0012B72B5E|nr:MULTISPECIES: hypothetical protein [unclassified Flavobacterium]MBF4518425.1 hypothetical protein [Flavobacterium sp. ANB]MTD70881.1 hypothetical protein [Flavobacterium sp. LC2016-13]
MIAYLAKRNFHEPIIWEGDLNDDCTANWAGLMLRAEWIDEDHWWWCVYDMLDEDEIQIDSSNEYEESFIGGKIAREKAEEISKKYLKNKIIEGALNFDNYKTSNLIYDLKVLQVSPIQTMLFLNKNLNIELSQAKDLVFDSEHWEGLRESSERLTQEFLNAGAELADEVEYVDGEVVSLTFDLTKDKSKPINSNDDSFWSKMKAKFKI